ncbi:hypothetical protein Sjap_018502 [Stephania japonica]|uniref:Protein TONSOKU n=1 Tax=Stephania japonica TaxID=461633 RepID=A0AAP0I876_9MAGN
MARDDAELSAAKRAYRQATSVGSSQEEARWANMIGNILKNRGEYVEALKWFRIDYEISVKFLPEKQLLPTCQSLGEVYLRLQEFKQALIYQKKHLELAKDSEDLVEQQRAMTQLGRTYHEMFLKSDDDHCSVRNAKKYFRSAMKLVRTLKESTRPNKSSNFLKEFIDAHNNIGMIEMDLDNLDAAEKILLEGLKLCDEEEVIEDDDGRSRLHHNLGSVYMEMRRWNKAREHIEKDIIICKRIGHRQGEAKGYINLGELHYRLQKYEESLMCYQKAHDVVKSLEDEDALVENIDENIRTIKEAAKVMDELKNEEQNLKKQIRTTAIAKGTPRERKCLLQQNASLDLLIEKASMIFAWEKHLEFAKKKKSVATEICDKEKLSDSFLAIGESYQKLRNFIKALKWYQKSWTTYKSIGNLEVCFPCQFYWIFLYLNFECRFLCIAMNFNELLLLLAVEANLPAVQISALENMHYSHMIRFDNVEEAKRLQNMIQDLKSSKNTKVNRKALVRECCSETESEEDEDSSHDGARALNSSKKMSESASNRSKRPTIADELMDDSPLISLLDPTKKISYRKASDGEKRRKPTETSPTGISKSVDNQFPLVGRKRVRVVLSDDESDGHNETEVSKVAIRDESFEDLTTSCEFRKREGSTDLAYELQDASLFVTREIPSASTPINLEQSSCSFKSGSSKVTSHNVRDLRFGSAAESPNASNFQVSGSKNDEDHVSGNLLENDNHDAFNLLISDEEYIHHMTFKIEDKIVHVDGSSCMVGDYLSIECLKVEVACIYYLQLSEEKKARGLLPIIRHLKCGRMDLEPFEVVKNLKRNGGVNNWIEVETDGWVQKRLMKLYIDCCKKWHEAPHMKLLKKLYRLEVSEDEVVLSDCELQDVSITPLLDALQQHKTIAVLDLSHNLLGNETMEKLQQIFLSSSQKYGGLTLDLHCNRLGPTSLFQICECPVLLARLEVLNISGNRLTDACGSYLSSILENCKALYCLNIEQCSITSRTIQKVADAIGSESVLAQLYLGTLSSVIGAVTQNLMNALSTVTSLVLMLSFIKRISKIIQALAEASSKSLQTKLYDSCTSSGNGFSAEITESLYTAWSSGLRSAMSNSLLSIYLHGLLTRLAMDRLFILHLGTSNIENEGNRNMREWKANNSICFLRQMYLPELSLGSIVCGSCHGRCSGRKEREGRRKGNLQVDRLGRTTERERERATQEREPRVRERGDECLPPRLDSWATGEREEGRRERERESDVNESENERGRRERGRSVCLHDMHEMGEGGDLSDESDGGRESALACTTLTPKSVPRSHEIAISRGPKEFPCSSCFDLAVRLSSLDELSLSDVLRPGCTKKRERLIALLPSRILANVSRLTNSKSCVGLSRASATLTQSAKSCTNRR